MSTTTQPLKLSNVKLINNTGFNQKNENTCLNTMLKHFSDVRPMHTKLLNLYYPVTFNTFNKSIFTNTQPSSGISSKTMFINTQPSIGISRKTMFTNTQSSKSLKLINNKPMNINRSLHYDTHKYSTTSSTRKINYEYKVANFLKGFMIVTGVIVVSIGGMLLSVTLISQIFGIHPMFANIIFLIVLAGIYGGIAHL